MLEEILKRGYGRIVGLDLSWNATGWAARDGSSGKIQFGALPAVGGSDVERLDTVLNGVLGLVDGSTLVILEDFAFARGNVAHQLGGLGYLVRHALWRAQIPFILVGPKQRSKFCTGNGNAKKDLILKYVEKHFGVDTDDHNAGDACVLNFIGQSLLGWYTPKLEFQQQVLEAIRVSYSSGARSKVKKTSRKKAGKLDELVAV
jgi:crossover junction endodeoxyribonuclease RuvC